MTQGTGILNIRITEYLKKGGGGEGEERGRVIKVGKRGRGRQMK